MWGGVWTSRWQGVRWNSSCWNNYSMSVTWLSSGGRWHHVMKELPATPVKLWPLNHLVCSLTYDVPSNCWMSISVVCVNRGSMVQNPSLLIQYHYCSAILNSFFVWLALSVLMWKIMSFDHVMSCHVAVLSLAMLAIIHCQSSLQLLIMKCCTYVHASAVSNVQLRHGTFSE